MWGMYLSNLNVKINFSVFPSSVVYLGTLNYGFESMHNYFIVKTGKSYLWISDEREETIRMLQEKFPDLTGNVKINLMEISRNEETTKKVKF